MLTEGDKLENRSLNGNTMAYEVDKEPLLQDQAEGWLGSVRLVQVPTRGTNQAAPAPLHVSGVNLAGPKVPRYPPAPGACAAKRPSAWHAGNCGRQAISDHSRYPATPNRLTCTSYYTARSPYHQQFPKRRQLDTHRNQLIASPVPFNMTSRTARASLLGALALSGAVSALNNYTSSYPGVEALRAQLALMDDRPADCPPWSVFPPGR